MISQGKIIFFNDKKGYGFISQNGNGSDVYFHAVKVKHRNERDKLKPNTKIIYRSEISTKTGKEEAFDVEIV